MQIESIKRWHWCVIGAVVGCGFAAVSLWAGPKEPASTDTVSHAEFEREVIRGFNHEGWEVMDVRNLQLHPDLEIYNEYTKSTIHTDYFTYEYDGWQRIRGGTGPGAFKVHPKVVRVIPFKPSFNGDSFLGKDVTKMSAREYLEKLTEHLKKLAADDKDKKKYPKLVELKYHKAFIEDPKTAYAVYGGAGVVLIGLVWPTLLNLLLGAGFGREIKEKTMDLSRFKGKTKETKKAEVTEDDMDRLKALEAQLEASLMEGARERVATAGVATVEAPIAKLVGGSAATEVATKEQKAKDFGTDQTDFYPTEIHGKKK